MSTLNPGTFTRCLPTSPFGALRIVWRGGDDRRKLREALFAIAY